MPSTRNKAEETDEVSKQLAALTSSINMLIRKNDSHEDKLDSIQRTVEISEGEIKATRKDFADYKATTNARLSELEKNAVTTRSNDARIGVLEKELRDLRNETKRNKLLSEHHNKKYNIIIHGIKERETFNDNGLAVWESCIDTTDSVRDFFADVLLVDKNRRWNFVNVHRLGMPRQTGPRGIIVRFSDMRHKDEVMDNLFRLKNYNQNNDGSKIYVQEQLPERMAKQRKMLIPKFKQARKEKKKTRWAIDKNTADYVLYISKIKIDSGYVTTDDEMSDHDN